MATIDCIVESRGPDEILRMRKDANPHILRMVERTFWLDATHNIIGNSDTFANN